MRRTLLLCVVVLAGLAACGDNLHPTDEPDGPPATPPDGPPVIDASADASPPDAAVPEVCDNTIDDDLDGDTDCADSDCAAFPACNPEVMCNDGADNDGDGSTDCADSDCATAPNCLPEGLCSDGTDNDGDGMTDCADSDCVGACLAGCSDIENTVSLSATGLPLPVSDTLPDVDVTFDVPADGWITGGAVHFTITHTYDADLDISLETPAARSLVLSDSNGGSDDNYIDTVVTDTATTDIADGTAPFTGQFRPDEPFSDLAGAPAMGTWHYRVADGAGGDDGTVDAVDLYLCVCNGTAGCETNLACQDGVDNDADGLIDCADTADCGAVPQCSPETNCTDNVDNDLDGKFDCADPDCNGVGTCEFPEQTCNDGIDNDDNTLADCADPNCLTLPLCGSETNCANGVDDDGDGLIDCADPGCNGAAGCELGVELTCSDGFDNDGDGNADCADTDCGSHLDCVATTCPAGTSRTIYTATDVPIAIPDSPGGPVVSTIAVPAGLASLVAVEMTIVHTFDADLDITLLAPGGDVELTTDNGSGGDNFTGTVFLDSAATSVTTGVAPFAGSYQPEQPLASLFGTATAGDWQLQIQDDAGTDVGTLQGYRLLLCQCDAGSGSCEFGPLACRNGSDDDGNGLTDCADPGCAADPTCSPETTCDDDTDNDLDGDIDCLDTDCNGVDGCEVGTELSCADGFDNDADGNADCFDPDCATDPACLVELDCGNGIDDDGDGLIDCPDPDCATDLGCAPEIDCNDGIDNDGDGEIDCLDQGCDGLQSCELGTEVSCTDGFDNDGDGAVDCADANCGAQLICSVACPAGSIRTLYTATDVPKAIPDNMPLNPANVTIAITSPNRVTGVAVQVDITHTFDGDVDIFLVAPGGTRELSTDNGSSGDNYTGTVFVDSAATAITTGVAPFTGKFRPEQNLAALNTTPLGGSWSLQAGDDAGTDVGTLTGYQLVTCSCDPAGGECEFGQTACTNGGDDDGDGLIDCADPNCATVPICIPHEHVCNDGLDDDGDGQTDCADADCGWVCTALGTACTAPNRLITYSSVDLPLAIATAGTPTVDSFFTVPIAGPILTAAVRFNATHTFDGDITLTLQSPAATTVELTSGNGVSGDNYVNTVFVDTAATLISAGAPTAVPPFTGSFRPEQLLAGFATQASNGTWHAQLRDTANGDGGSWTEFSLGACIGP